MKFDPPMLTRGPLSNAIYVVTHGKIDGETQDGHQRILATRKYDVTEQFESLRRETLSHLQAIARAKLLMVADPIMAGVFDGTTVTGELTHLAYEVLRLTGGDDHGEQE